MKIGFGIKTFDIYNHHDFNIETRFYFEDFNSNRGQTSGHPELGATLSGNNRDMKDKKVKTKI